MSLLLLFWVMFRQPERNGQASESSKTEVVCQSMLLVVKSVKTNGQASLMNSSYETASDFLHLKMDLTFHSKINQSRLVQDISTKAVQLPLQRENARTRICRRLWFSKNYASRFCRRKSNSYLLPIHNKIIKLSSTEHPTVLPETSVSLCYLWILDPRSLG